MRLRRASCASASKALECCDRGRAPLETEKDKSCERRRLRWNSSDGDPDDISVDDNNLIISGKKKQKSEETDRNYYRVERSCRSFRRSPLTRASKSNATTPECAGLADRRPMCYSCEC